MSTINVRVLLKFQIFISYSVGIITDYVNFHTFENVRITLYLSEKLEFWSGNQNWLKTAKSYPVCQKSALGTVQFFQSIRNIQTNIYTPLF